MESRFWWAHRWFPQPNDPGGGRGQMLALVLVTEAFGRWPQERQRLVRAAFQVAVERKRVSDTVVLAWDGGAGTVATMPAIYTDWFAGVTFDDLRRHVTRESLLCPEYDRQR